MPKEGPTDVGDVKQVKGRKKKFELEREQQLEDIRQILKTPFGKGLLWRILCKCHMFHTISHHDATRMAIKSGERDIGLWVLEELEAADPNAYIKLCQDNQKRESK